jgi:hypothetical protein
MRLEELFESDASEGRSWTAVTADGGWRVDLARAAEEDGINARWRGQA